VARDFYFQLVLACLDTHSEQGRSVTLIELRPSSFAAISIDTPLSSNETAKVSRNRDGCIGTLMPLMVAHPAGGSRCAAVGGLVRVHEREHFRQYHWRTADVRVEDGCERPGRRAVR
jgi:hypothetical protein